MLTDIYSYHDTISYPCAIRGTGIFCILRGGFHMKKRPMTTEKSIRKVKGACKKDDQIR